MKTGSLSLLYKLSINTKSIRHYVMDQNTGNKDIMKIVKQSTFNPFVSAIRWFSSVAEQNAMPPVNGELHKALISSEASEQPINNSSSGQKKSQDSSSDQYNWKWSRNDTYQSTIAISNAIIAFTAFLTARDYLKKLESEAEEVRIKAQVEKIKADLVRCVTQLSPDNIIRSQNIKNQEFISQVKNSLYEIQNDEKIRKYFTEDMQLLQKLLHSFHVIACYDLYNHDSKSAKSALCFAKELNENCMNNKHANPVNFDGLIRDKKYDELYNELNRISPELVKYYTKIIYQIGRTHLYSQEISSVLEGRQYFECSEYLGKKLELFEGYLSVMSGAAAIAMREIEAYLKVGDNLSAAKKLNDIIAIYKALKVDNSKYIKNYNAFLPQQEIIDPTNDIYNQAKCSEQIVKAYGKLLLITDDQNKQKDYSIAIATVFIGDDKTEGILKQMSKLSGRESASIYNNLGNILFNFYEKNIECTLLKTEIIKVLGLNTEIEYKTNNKDLTIIAAIFNKAKTLSTVNDFTKADSLDGLIKVYKKLIELSKLEKQNFSIDEQARLQQQIEKYTEEKNEINKGLHRSQSATSVLEEIECTVLRPHNVFIEYDSLHYDEATDNGNIAALDNIIKVIGEG